MVGQSTATEISFALNQQQWMQSPSPLPLSEVQLEEKESKGISCKYRKSLFAVTQPETIKGSIFTKNSSAGGCGREYWGFW